tara:strand:- start:836 stop:1081 length:246 start_codon:yes stop_codon:yes gene_type:complete
MKKLIFFVLPLIVATNFYSQFLYFTSGGSANTTDSNVESIYLTLSNSTSIDENLNKFNSGLYLVNAHQNGKLTTKKLQILK